MEHIVREVDSNHPNWVVLVYIIHFWSQARALQVHASSWQRDAKMIVVNRHDGHAR